MWTLSCKTLYDQINFLKPDDIYQLEINKLTHTFHSNRMPSTFDHLFTAIYSVHTHQTRSSTSDQYFCHPVRSQYGKRSTRLKGPRIWQQIDSSLKGMPTITFKKRYRNSIIESDKNHYEYCFPYVVLLLGSKEPLQKSISVFLAWIM